MESAETEKNNTIQKVQDVDSKLVKEYAVSEEQEKVAIGLIEALLEATSKDGTVSPMNFNQSAFQASEAYQVKDEVAENMKDYRDFKKQEEETREVKPDMEAIYAGLAKQNIKSGRSDDSIMDPNTGDYVLTFKGKRKVLGGNGPGTPDGLAPYAVVATDFLLGDIATMVGPGSTAGSGFYSTTLQYGCEKICEDDKNLTKKKIFFIEARTKLLGGKPVYSLDITDTF